MLRSASVAVLLACTACSTAAEAPAPGATSAPAAKPALDPATAKSLISGGAVVVDVRSPEEFAGGHVASAVNLPIQTFASAEVDKLVGGDKSKPVVVYCGAGGRAAKAKEQLESAGYKNVVNGGGYTDLR